MDPVIIAVVAIVCLVISIPVIIKVCRHHTCKTWDEVQPDGFQYCIECGMGREPEKQPCVHPKWKVVENSQITRQTRRQAMGIDDDKKRAVIGNHYILQCEKCNDIKDYVLKI